MHIAIALADADDKLNEKKVEFSAVCEAAGKAHDSLLEKGLTKEELCSRIYEPLAVSNPVSKPTTAQYLSELLEDSVKRGALTSEGLRELLPSYVLEAIAYVTAPFPASKGTAATPLQESEASACLLYTSWAGAAPCRG